MISDPYLLYITTSCVFISASFKTLFDLIKILNLPVKLHLLLQAAWQAPLLKERPRSIISPTSTG